MSTNSFPLPLLKVITVLGLLIVLVALRLELVVGDEVCIYGLEVDVVFKVFGRTALALGCQPTKRLVFVDVLSSGPSGESGASGLCSGSSSGFGFGGFGRDGFMGGDGGFGAGAGGAGLGAGGGGAAATAARSCGWFEMSIAHVVVVVPSRISISGENNIVNVRVGCGVKNLTSQSE
jgi:hypothetical protein